MSAVPQRIKFMRHVPGWNLQRASLALNGLPARKIDRSTDFGNPFRAGQSVDRRMATRWGWTIADQEATCADTAEAVRRFAHCLIWDEAIHDWLRHELGGNNLSCWCNEAHDDAWTADDFVRLELSRGDVPGIACHGRPLLFVANSTTAAVHRIHARIDDAIERRAAAVMAST